MAVKVTNHDKRIHAIAFGKSGTSVESFKPGPNYISEETWKSLEAHAKPLLDAKHITVESGVKAPPATTTKHLKADRPASEQDADKDEEDLEDEDDDKKTFGSNPGVNQLAKKK